MCFFLRIAFILFLLVFHACGEKSSTAPGDTPAAGATDPSASGNQKPEGKARGTILFYGNSLSAAYGLDDPDDGFVGLIRERVDSLGLPYRVVNAGLSGETTKGGLERIDWILQQNDIDIFVLELGGNDALRGIDPSTSYQNLQSIVGKVKDRFPSAWIILAGMEAPPNMGSRYTTQFRQIYKRLAAEQDLTLMPFLLEDVGGIPELNLADGIHPNAEGHRIIAENLWAILASKIEQ